MIILPEEKTFASLIADQIAKAENGRVYVTKFLTLREQALVKELGKGHHVSIDFFGGYPGAERCKACIYPDDIEFEPDYQIQCLQIKYNKRYLSLTHQNVLGTLMSLQLDRSLFGDIVFDDDKCYFFVSLEYVPLLKMEFTMINHVPITLAEYSETIAIKQKYIQKEIIISSLRIDNLISHVYNLSREVSKKHILAGLVARNFLIVTDSDEKCAVNDVISVRKFGRFQIAEVLRTTKAGKLVVLINIPTA